jgi:myosin heavy subunit
MIRYLRSVARNPGFIVCCSSLVRFFWFLDVSIISSLHCDAQNSEHYSHVAFRVSDARVPFRFLQILRKSSTGILTMKKAWLPNKDTAWDLVDVLSVGKETNDAERTLSVTVPLPAEGGGAGRLRTTATVLQSTTVPYDDSHGIPADQLHDLCAFNMVHEAPLVDGLHRRYRKDLIYTNIGNNLLVSINPCKEIDVYDTIIPYLSGPSTDSKEKSTDVLQPHIFALANHALSEKDYNAAKRAASQSIMVCGESGSGKTEASKYVMHFLLQADKEHQRHLNSLTVGTLNAAFSDLSTGPNKGKSAVGKGSAADTAVLSSILGPSSVIFESFGNARTQHNGNSSRFGKYTKFQYSADQRLISAYTETFLLEQTRLVTVGEGEQNYHIFYALLNTKAEASRLKLTRASDFKILCDSQAATDATATRGARPGAADELQRNLSEVSTSLRAVDVTQEELQEIWSLLAALLHLGNIECRSIVDEFKPQADDNYEQVELISPSMPLSELCYLLGVSSLTFEVSIDVVLWCPGAFCMRTTKLSSGIRCLVSVSMTP